MSGRESTNRLDDVQKWSNRARRATDTDFYSQSGMAAMQLALRDLFQCSLHPVTVSYRLTLLKGHVFRLPRTCPTVHVLSGAAWVTAGRKERRDIVLGVGETTSFAPEKDFVLISALGSAPLNLEVQGVHRYCPNWLKIRCWRRLIRKLVTG